MRRKLYTFGCSYTKFEWLTWVDFLTPYFSETRNFGESGAGNSYIFNSFANLAANDILQPGDTVIIEWSSLMRENKIFSMEGGYKLGGFIYNNHLYSKEYVKKYFNPIQTAFELVSYITSAKSICKDRGVNLKMFYMLTPWLGDSFGEPFSIFFPNEDIKNNVHKIFMESRILEVLKGIYDDNFIQLSLEEYNLDNKTNICYLEYRNSDHPGLFLDHHPAPNMHFRYAHSYILPWLKSIFSNLKEVPYLPLYEISEFWTKNLADIETAQKFYNTPSQNWDIDELKELGYFFPHILHQTKLSKNETIVNSYDYKKYNKYY
jgi:hypothetical protein